MSEHFISVSDEVRLVWRRRYREAIIRMPSLFFGQKWELITACRNIGVSDVLMDKKSVYIVEAELLKTIITHEP